MIRKIILLTLIIFANINVAAVAKNELPSKNGNWHHGISIFGNLKYQKNFKNFDYVNPSAKKGGKVKYGVEGTFNSLNPFILKGISASGISMAFDSLMEGSDDEISAMYGLVAKSVFLSKDQKSITFNLRKEAKFHDGSKIKADDVIFSFEKISKEGHPSYQMIYRDIVKAEKINDYQVKFTFKDSKNRQLPITIAGLPVISKKYYEQFEFNKSSLEIPLSSGPYKVKNIDPGRSITYERVKDYWAKNLPINKGRHNFDEITYEYYLDGNILVEAFKAGNFDFRQENVSRNWSTAYNIGKVQNGDIIKKEVPHSLPTGMQAFVLNLRKEKFKNKYLRQSLNYAFDFEWVKKNIFYGAYKRNNSFFVNTDFANQELPKGKELAIIKKLQNKFPNDVPNDVFEYYFTNPRTNGTGYDRVNLKTAKSILKKGGYEIVNKKLVDPKTKKPVEIEFLIGSKSFTMIIAPMKKNLEKLGIKSKVRLVDENQYKIRVNEFDYDIVITVFGQALIPGNEQYAYWHSSGADVKGSRNLTGVRNKAVDYLIEKIIRTKNKDKLEIYTSALDRILLWNFYVIPQWYNNSYRILYKNKFGIPKIKPLYSIGLDSWWIK